ncbi:NAD(FAD)-dependent dehydrogenase [Desulfitobacterium dichloroeliminans LMG P-21439]|uniref:NAD(FAD)-dependent dehydrogenase n=1 Tax=Desulfitobacterium dichloroeliminans (strain LMG P-21439 / DCA1) TaxID=871963 RepID=L0FC26_DESDL|nr:FAD/NAD(P)-binding oxidoreductase [Desulfitobacterium dichloroeliminans]AGA70777.1 NAD(FAD)-dependent dehydrogenase [Desulfitobacterium dichloroeliminans LMG P-21439]
MKRVLILGAGTAGTMMANHLNRKLNKKEWAITIVDQYEKHYYQPGFLFIPFDIYSERDVIKRKTDFIPKDVEYIKSTIELIEADKNQVVLKNDWVIPYDVLIIATGCEIVPGEVDGVMEAWRKDIFDFYTIEGSVALRDKLKDWQGGKLVVHVTEMPIKCPVAPLEFIFLADWFFKEKLKMRDKVELIYVTPLDGAFTKQTCSDTLSYLFPKKNIKMINNFSIPHVDAKNKKLISVDGKEVDYDLLVTVPVNMGSSVIDRSNLGDELNFVPTDKHTLQSKKHENIFVIGDATDLPASKAGSVAHFQAEILTENILSYIVNKPLKAHFDGHANCYIESGYNKALLIDFNYDIEPVEGTFPIPGIGPFSLLKESRINHLGKLAFKTIYWNMLLRGIPIPTVTAELKTSGKKLNNPANPS